MAADRAGRQEEEGAVLLWQDGRLVPDDHQPVREFPLTLRVNGQELATLVASPHDPEALVVGFLRTQGLVRERAEIRQLEICQAFGLADIILTRPVPEGLSPVLTSGCGSGLVFHLPGVEGEAVPVAGGPVRPADLFALMAALGRHAEGYRAHGGIHSAGVGRGDRLLLWAEDIGRHNTLDRLAGAALLAGEDLAGATLVASGRVSSEMLAKAYTLGISCLASRTSPTDLAVAAARRLGITLIGYLRGRRFTVYSHAERLLAAPAPALLDEVTGVILAGGASRRMGRDKAFLPLAGEPLVAQVHRTLAGIFRHLVLVTNTPERFAFLGCPLAGDFRPGLGALAGIQAALAASPTERIFVAACDMPALNPALIRALCAWSQEAAVVVPEGTEGLEPLHAVYSRRALPAIAAALAGGERRVQSFFPRVTVAVMPRQEVARLDPGFASFRNLNTPADYLALPGADPGALADDLPCP
ncbi:MAG: formate dehydrogenase accessory sulfurtransferase FdhD [Thermodesulfobacteriota bacterium]